MKKTVKILFSSLAISLLLCASATNAKVVTVAVPIVSQAPYMESACWAAVGASICQFRGNYVSKEQFAAKSGTPITQRASIYVVGNTLNSYGAVTSYQSGFMYFSSVKSHIDQNKTMAVNVFGHAVTLRGYNDDNTNLPQTIFMDPATGRYDTYRHNDLIEGYQGFKWVDAAIVYN